MDLSTTYLGLKLPHPLMPGSYSQVEDLDVAKRLEDAGAAAIVMPSLFEEQITLEELHMIHQMEVHDEGHQEALSYFPKPDQFRLGPENYLEQIRKIKGAVSIPIIASLNGMTPSGWVNYARKMQDAGASALELNIYYLATNPKDTGSTVEKRAIEVLRSVKGAVTIPVAIKLSPFYSALANFARKLTRAGADGIVLFNRFYQPDIDIDKLETTPTLAFSHSSELLLRLRWLAILSGNVKASLCVTGGVHTAADAIKAVMCGAHAVQMVSALIQKGPDHLKVVLDGMKQWLEEHEYGSLKQMRGTMSLKKCPDPEAFERANYMKVLRGYRP